MIATRRIEQEGPIQDALQRLLDRILVLPITFEIAAMTAYLPSDFPSDPMDRIIAATAQVEGIPLVTADERILGCASIKTIW
jgi:PIN domain nuclease of toxin-antitoxin system